MPGQTVKALRNKPVTANYVMKKSSDSRHDMEMQGTAGRSAFQGSGLLRQLCCLTLLLLLYPAATGAETLTGKPYITDGDVVKISGKRIRLEGIDAPEPNQRCKDASGKSYGCGLVSTAALRTKIGRNSITCEGTMRDRYGRFLGICYLGELDLNGWLVRNGYALAYRRYSKRYVRQELQAREDGLGLWAGEFIPPWQWRRQISLATEPRKENGYIELVLQNPLQFEKPGDHCGSELCRSLVELLDGARKNIDFAIYGTRNQTEILNAIIRAKKRGVSVRGYVDKDKNNRNYYASTEKWKNEIGDVRDDLVRESVCKKRFGGPGGRCDRPDGFQGPLQCVAYNIGEKYLVANHASREPIVTENLIMHNKFFVVDGLYVWTGSANISDSGTGGYNANAVVIVKSAGVASVYTEEFNRLWNRSSNKCEKSRNGVERFRLGRDEITTWFSPQDMTSRYGIKSLVSKARKNINVAVFFLTSKYLAADLIAAHRRGVRVRVIVDATAAKNGYSKHELLREAGIPVKVENWGGKMHMKSASVDGRFLVMGSMNWTSAGESSNDENTLLIKSKQLASEFDDYYREIWRSVPQKWEKKNARPDPESRDSQTACSDEVDNDFDRLADGEDPGCSENPPEMPPLPPHRLLEKDKEARDVLKQYRFIRSPGCHTSYPDWFVCIPEKKKYKTGCEDIPYRNFKVTGEDPAGFATGGGGVGCFK